ncbi:hypothetical protein [Roseibium sp. Sym1]|uniref:hypothetical protein n=1 Tax=Roseibium sp. Sym1 TaxID=3016006 RepID=UPI0022B4748E|nr:hypothetical protein [Roseibium sp. Sym1]
MSAAAYNLENRWEIPAYVWPAVLGVSVALHISIFLFGLPLTEWENEPVDPPLETEVIIESGGPVFEDVALAEPSPTASEPVEPALVATRPEVPLAPAVPSELKDLQPLAAEPADVSTVPVEEIESAEVPILSQVAPNEIDISEVPEVTNVAPVQVQAIEVPPAETIESVPPETGPDPEVVVADPAIPVVSLSPADTVVPLAVTSPAVAEIAAENVTDTPLAQPDREELTTIDAEAVEVIASSEERTELIAETPNGTASLIVDQAAVDVAAGPQVVSETPPEALVDAEPVTVVAANPVPVISSEETALLVGETEEVVTVLEAENTQIETVSPLEQQLTEIEQVETEVAALSPAEPDTAAVPSVELPSAPADIVPAAEVATIDPLADVTRYVSNYNAGDCAHLSVVSAGADNAQVTAFGPGIGPFAVFDRRFADDQGYEASIELRIVTRQQCALLDALGVSGGVEAAGLVELDKTLVKSGALLTGLIQRDLPLARIAAARETGLDLSGKGPPELYLIDDAGRIHDGRDYLLPASNARTAGAWRFKIPVHLTSAVERETALILAVWNRPASRQPARFGTLPSARIAAILAEPGVYSLAAFKVSR